MAKFWWLSAVKESLDLEGNSTLDDKSSKEAIDRLNQIGESLQTI